MDTSTLVAGMVPSHVHNASAEPWLARAKAGAFEFFISVHSIAEMYSVLTRLPLKPPIGPTQAHQLISDNVLSCAKTVTLSESDYVGVITNLAQRGIGGGIVYDAVIARAAEVAQVDHLVTLNTSHFQRAWPAGAARVLSALTPPP